MENEKPAFAPERRGPGIRLKDNWGLILATLALIVTTTTAIHTLIKDADESREILVVFTDPEYVDGKVELSSGSRKDYPSFASMCFPLNIINNGKTNASVIAWDCADMNQNPMEIPVNPWLGIFTDPDGEHKVDLPISIDSSRAVHYYILMAAGLEPKVDAILRKRYKLPCKVPRMDFYNTLAQSGTNLFGNNATLEDLGGGAKRQMALVRLDDQPVFHLRVKSGRLKTYETGFRFR